MDMNLSKLWEILKDRGAWHAAVHGVTKSQTWLRNWKTATIYLFIYLSTYLSIFHLPTYHLAIKEIYYMELAHIIIEFEKFHFLL